MTRRELAQYLGVGEDAVRKAEDIGRIRAGDDGLFDADQAVRDWAMNRRGNPGGSGGRPRKDRGAAGDTLIEVQTRHEKVKLAERKVKLARMKAELVDRKAVEKRVFELIRAQRERFLNWPADAAPRIAAALEADPVRVEIALEREVRKLLEESTAEGLMAAPAGERAA